MNDEFIAGFFTGEGFLSKQIIKNNKTKKEYLSFSVGLHLNNRDEVLLNKIKEYLGYGNILICKPTRNKDGSFSVACQWRTGRTNNLHDFSNRIGSLLLGHKKEQFD